MKSSFEIIAEREQKRQRFVREIFSIRFSRYAIAPHSKTKYNVFKIGDSNTNLSNYGTLAYFYKHLEKMNEKPLSYSDAMNMIGELQQKSGEFERLQKLYVELQKIERGDSDE